jgi:hypothetical protein
VVSGAFFVIIHLSVIVSATVEADWFSVFANHIDLVGSNFFSAFLADASFAVFLIFESGIFLHFLVLITMIIVLKIFNLLNCYFFDELVIKSFFC